MCAALSAAGPDGMTRKDMALSSLRGWLSAFSTVAIPRAVSAERQSLGPTEGSWA